MTPEQMRALADENAAEQRIALTPPVGGTVADWGKDRADLYARNAAALRAAADQLEAVREWAELELEGEQPTEYQRGYQMAAAHARRFVVTAATAPQEDRDA